MGFSLFSVGKRKLDPIQPPRFVAATDPERAVEVAQGIDRINQAVYALSPNDRFADDMQAFVVKAQQAAGSGKWDDAHNAIWGAIFRLNRAIESINCTGLQALLIFSPLCTVLVLILFKVVMQWLYPELITSMLDSGYFDFLWLGAIGGTTIALWGIVKHSRELDFDREYIYWYLCKPLLGAITAAIAVLIVKAGLFTLQQTTTPNNKMPLYVVAYLAGFSERFFIDLIDRVLAALFGGETSNPSRPSSRKPPPSAPPNAGQ